MHAHALDRLDSRGERNDTHTAHAFDVRVHNTLQCKAMNASAPDTAHAFDGRVHNTFQCKAMNASAPDTA